MNIYHEVPDKRLFKSPVLTIGNFDGVHMGHHRILSTLLNKARDKAGDPIALTFSNHPRKILTPLTPPKILTTSNEKVKAIGNCGIGNVILLDFTKELADMTAIDFFNNIIMHKFGVIDIVVGYDHAFGKDRQGTYDFLKDLSRIRGFAVTRVNPKSYFSRPISSTWIRAELEDGNVSLANILLGRRYSIHGTVVGGAGRGNKIGFPTANLEIDDQDKILPKDGVYAVLVLLNDKIKKGMLNIGMNPTFSETERKIEVNIFDFAEDIYGTEIIIEFYKRIRGEVKFESPELLVKQLKKDRIQALDLLIDF